MTPDEFKVIRKNYKLTQAQMAEALGVSRLTVYNWEKAKFAFPPDIVERMTRANLAAPAQLAARAKHITRESHPQCFLPDGRYTLAHPRWYAASDSPLRHGLPPEAYYAVLPEHVEKHTAPAPEIVWGLFQRLLDAAPRGRHHDMLAHSCVKFMQDRGFTQFGTVTDRGPLSDAELLA